MRQGDWKSWEDLKRFYNSPSKQDIFSLNIYCANVTLKLLQLILKYLSANRPCATKKKLVVTYFGTDFMDIISFWTVKEKLDSMLYFFRIVIAVLKQFRPK